MLANEPGTNSWREEDARTEWSALNNANRVTATRRATKFEKKDIAKEGDGDGDE